MAKKTKKDLVAKPLENQPIIDSFETKFYFFDFSTLDLTTLIRLLDLFEIECKKIIEQYPNKLDRPIYSLNSKQGAIYTFNKKEIIDSMKNREVFSVNMTFNKNPNAPIHTYKGIELSINNTSRVADGNLLSVKGEDINWVSGLIQRFKEELDTSKNGHKFLYTTTAEFLFQISSVIAILYYTYYLSVKFEPIFRIPQMYLFLIIFIIFSNIWTYLSLTIKNYLSKNYPVVKIETIKKQEYLKYLLTTIFVGVIGNGIYQLLIEWLKHFFGH